MGPSDTEGHDRDLEQRVGSARRMLERGDPEAPAAVHRALLDAHVAGSAAWSYRLTTLLPDLLAWAGLVEDPLHYTDGPVPSRDWIASDLARYADDHLGRQDD